MTPDQVKCKLTTILSLEPWFDRTWRPAEIEMVKYLKKTTSEWR